MEKKSIIEKLVKDGAKAVKNLKVKGVNILPKNNYVSVSLSLDKPVRGYVSQDDGSFTEGERNVVFISLFSIAAQLRDNDDAAFAVNHILSRPESLVVLLNGATIDILQEDVVSGQEYHNPWASNADNVSVFDHDTIINHLINIKMSDKANKMLEKLAESMMGI